MAFADADASFRRRPDPSSEGGVSPVGGVGAPGDPGAPAEERNGGGGAGEGGTPPGGENEGLERVVADAPSV